MSEAGTIENESEPATSEASGSVRRATHSLEEATKNLGRQAKEVFTRSLELQQLSLIGEVEFEEALLFDGETIRKKYTAEQAEKMEWRRDLCLYLISRETPVEDIGKLLRMNLRTVSAIAAKHGRMLGAFTEDFANRLIAGAASDIALADTKRDAASYKDLHIGAGIKMQHAMGVKLMADSGGLQPAVDIEAEDGKLKSLRDKIKQLKPAAEAKSES